LKVIDKYSDNCDYQVGDIISAEIGEVPFVDYNEECPDWATWSPSECEVNPDYMLVNCQKSCESYLEKQDSIVSLVLPDE
jgi:hypothetical protein